MSESYQDILEDVKNDRRSGAWGVARKTINCLEALATEKSGDSGEEFIKEMERVAKEILEAQPGMAQLIHLFNSVFNTIDAQTSDDTLALSRKISGEAKRFNEASRNAVAKVAELGADLIANDSVVLIHSNSSTILEILKKARSQEKSFQVILSESRPICEGRACATEVSKLGIQNIYLFDAAIAIGVERADLILLGTDSLSETELVNKIGTKAICLLAKENVVPCYAACESSKFLPQKIRPKKEQQRDPNEVWENPPPETVVENYYLDTDVPLDLFNGIITEEGVFTPKEIGGKIGSQKLNSRILNMLK